MPSALAAVPFVGAALVLVTLPHHWRVGNFATLSIIAWLGAYDLVLGVNALLWAGNVEIKAEVWCDIATKIKIGADMALPGCCFCMAKRLNRIAYGLEMAPRGWKYRTLDIALCWAFPFLIMVLHYIVQGHRFDIVEDIGCIPATYISLPSLLILDLTAFIPAVLALIFCTSALYRLLRRRLQSHQVFFKPNPAITLGRYVRLMLMTFALGSWSAVLISISTSNAYSAGLLPYVSWAYVHEDFSFVGQFTTKSLYAVAEGTLRCLYILWIAVPVTSLVFFACFGIGKEAQKDYTAYCRWIGQRVFGMKLKRSEPSLTESVVWAASLDAEGKYYPRLEGAASGGTYVFDLGKELPPLPVR